MNAPTPKTGFLNVPVEVAYIFWAMIAIHTITDMDWGDFSDTLFALLVFVPDRYGDLLGYGIFHDVSAMVSFYDSQPLLGTVSYYLSPIGYMFLHANWVHVAFNGTMLLVFGKMSAPAWGRWTWIIFVLVGSAFSAFFAGYMERFDALVGASGAVSALIAGVLVSSIIGVGPLQKSTALSQLTMWVLMLVIIPIIAQDWIQDMTGSAVSWTGHLGGLLFGAIIGPFLWRK